MIAPGQPLEEARQALTRAFLAAGLDSPALDARILVGHVTGLDRTALMLRPADLLSAEDATRLAELARRRLAREPIARILGKQEFFGLMFQLSPQCLIPRPDSEVLVEAALDLCTGKVGRVLDLGTGPGTLLLAFLHNRPGWKGVGVDLSGEACATARDNAAQLGMSDRADFVTGSWTAPVSGQFDCILTNPPYISTSTCETLQEEVRDHDPRLALDGGSDGLNAYRSLAVGVMPCLAPDAILLVEAGAGQAREIMELFAASGIRHLETRCDLGGIARAVIFQRPDILL